MTEGRRLARAATVSGIGEGKVPIGKGEEKPHNSDYPRMPESNVPDLEHKDKLSQTHPQQYTPLLCPCRGSFMVMSIHPFNIMGIPS
jgi:hypothetical protein